MDRKKLENLRRELAQMRRSPQKSSAIQSLAERLGRKRADRGKEPTFKSEAFPSLRPLSIPGHKGRDLAPGTKNIILNLLEDGDIAAWDEFISANEHSNGSGNGKDGSGG